MNWEVSHDSRWVTLRTDADVAIHVPLGSVIPLCAEMIRHYDASRRDWQEEREAEELDRDQLRANIDRVLNESGVK